MNTPSIPAAIAPFWAAFEAARGAHVTSRFYEATHFDDNESGANHLATLVLAGKKRATAGLAWSFDGEKRPPPKPGDLSVVTDWDGVPLCVIETVSVSVVPFEYFHARHERTL
ncbi:ASCH domain-containing protein [Ramlibacter sp. WS9]|uniref:ASCH domain-containing protein n=1 Tax=Ramlibacter sp. WS9 TaxID=1882741 RepID=UPI001142B97C|nr:ASCH domain-containing protein [Ramlibacter sp. WS9]ROZ63885.1 ASCH domain-containing protein [Ramlibacter sp. WS9]